MSTSKIDCVLIGYKFINDDPEKIEEIEYDILKNKELNPNNVRIMYDSSNESFLGIVLQEVDNEDDYGSTFEISLSYLKKELKKNKPIIEEFVKKNELDFISGKIDGYVVSLYL